MKLALTTAFLLVTIGLVSSMDAAPKEVNNLIYLILLHTTKSPKRH